MALFFKKKKRVPRSCVDGHPVQIVEVKNKQLELYEDRLESILMQPRLKDIPVVVLSVAGVARAGKSFLLNLFIKYFSHNCSPTWMDDQESTLNGFVWEGGSDRVTTGIWMWSKVFITGPADRQFGVVLMDTQGTQDKYTPMRLNASMFALSTLLSSIQVYNIKSDINEADLQFLQLFVGYGIAVKNDNKPFQKLLFLIRDWASPREYLFGNVGGMKRLKKCMETSPMQSEENIQLRKSIYEVFDKIMCFLMPHPGNDVCEGVSKGQFKDIPERFKQTVMELVQLLFLSDVPELKRIDGKDVTCENLFNYFKRYMEVITDGELFEVEGIPEANAIAHGRKSYHEVMMEFEKQMNELCKIYQENINDICKEKKKKTLEDFNIKCAVNRTTKYQELEDSMKTDIENKSMNYISKNTLMEKMETNQQDEINTTNQIKNYTGPNAAY
ncbi:atlastin-1-like isoform X2 [Anneissia japonica]|uniref:atlastin-1-like isoform X2 n=2 Tax=Anneissia japonica TaxID=1529436 RepID=UPI001425BA98|nr:atlastin-1-like isoform X2 [Anneissia japonica]